MASSALNTIELVGLADANVPYFEQYFGLWAMHEEHFQALAQKLHGYDVKAHLIAVQTAQQAEPKAAAGGEGTQRPFALTADGIAMIPIRGTLMKQQSSMSGATSTVVARRQVRAAMHDEAVKAIVLHIESPGGTVAGTAELAMDIAVANSKKPVWSYIEDLGASAAYWIASQATKIVANRMAMVGSIGTYGVVYDLSQMAAKEGIKVHVIRAGAYKGMFTPGTEITADQVSQYQTLVTQMNEAFLEGVASGRKISVEAVRALADGRVHMAPIAQGINLIDAVDTLDGMLSSLRSSVVSKPGRSSKMSTENANPAAYAVATLQPLAASIDEITSACAGADDTFVLGQLRTRATLDQAKNAWMKQQAETITSLKAENAELKATVEAAKSKSNAAPPAKPGVNPVHADATNKSGGHDESDPVAAFNGLVDDAVKAGKSRADAIRHVVAKNPDLHDAYQAANTVSTKRRK